MTLMQWRRGARYAGNGLALLLVLWSLIFGALSPAQAAQAKAIEEDGRGAMPLAPIGITVAVFARPFGTSRPPGGGGGGGGAGGEWTPGTTDNGAALPLVKLDTHYDLAAQTGTVHRCDTEAEFATARTACARTDIIVLESGVTFDSTTTRTIPAKSGTGWVYIVAGDVYDDLFPKVPGQRVTSADEGDLALVRTTVANTPVFTFTHGASHPTHWRLVGLSLTSTANQQNGLIEIDGNTATDANLPEWIGVDRCRLWGTPGTVNVRRGMRMDGASCFAVDSDIIGFRDADSDSQGVFCVNATGPLKIVNCRLQATSENFISGGSVAQRKPQDIEFRYNYLDKDPAWEGVYAVKNHFELKFGGRIYVYGCVSDYCWISGQDGHSYLMGSTSQVGAGDGPQYKTNDIVITHCLSRYSQAPWQITGSTFDSTQSTDRMVIRHFLSVQKRSGDGYCLYLEQNTGKLNGLVVKNCTLETRGTYYQHVLAGSGGDSLIWEDNIAQGGLTPDWTAGPWGAGGGAGGATALAAAKTSYSVTGNACRGTWTTDTIAGNTASTATTFAGIFTDYAGGDYTVATGNWAEGVGTGGADPGADWAAVSDVIQYTISGQRPSEV